MTRKEKLILAHAAALKVAMDAGISKKELISILAMDAEAVAKIEDEPKKKVAEDDADKKREDESDEEYEARMKAKKDKPAEDEDDEEAEKAKAAKAKEKDGKAMDAAIKSAEDKAVKRVQAIQAAANDVKPVIGEIVAQDSAEDVYKLALDHLGVTTTDVHPSAFKSLFDLAKGKKPVIAKDSALDSAAQFKKDFPNAVFPQKV